MSRATYLSNLKLQEPIDGSNLNLKETVVTINRVTKVVKGGKNMSFAALVVVGDEKGRVGYGLGKAREVPMAIRKAIEVAKKGLIRVNLTETTVPHLVMGKYSASHVMIKPAPPGTGVIAGGPVRPVMEAVGIHNVFTKSIGNNNPHNVIKAVFDGLLKLKDRARVAELRGKDVQEL